MDYADVKVGVHIIIKGFPCKVLKFDVSAPGKHGHAKKRIVGQDILTDKKHECILSSGHRVDVPEVSRVQYQLQYIDDDGFMDLFDDAKGENRQDVRIGESELENEIREKCDNGDLLDVTILEVKIGDKVSHRVVGYTKDSA